MWTEGGLSPGWEVRYELKARVRRWVLGEGRWYKREREKKNGKDVGPSLA